MALGLNRQNDTPLGGLPEFRGNMQGGDVFNVDQVPVWDGEKFAPGSNSALLLGYGGLTTVLSAGHVADGSIIDDWDAVMPLGGVPLQMTPDPVTGLITVDQDGIYQVDFNIGLTSLANNIGYVFTLVLGGVDTNFGCAVGGSNNVSEQTTGFTLQVSGSVGGTVGVDATAPAGQGFDIVNGTLTVTRIG